MSSLGVQSIPELYGLLLGWYYYDHAWQLLTDTGLIVVPFMAILLNHSVGLMGRHPTALAVSLSLRQVSVECLSALVVMSLAGVPCQPLDPHYEQATATHTQTTFDHTLALNPTQAATVRVPLWWYGVIALTEGLTHALRQSATVPLDLRQLITTVHLTPLRDPHLRQQLTRFYQQCYTPARHTFLTQAPSPSALAHLQALLHVTPASIEDTEWLGGAYFLNTPGYYDVLRATQPVEGFVFDPDSDWIDAQVGTPPPWGRPTCRDWWLDPTVGLRQHILDTLPIDTQEALATHDNPLPPEAQDNAVRALLTHTSHGYASANHLIGHWSYSHLAEAVGIWTSAFKSYPKLYALIQAAPLVRALLLLLCYAFLPFALLLSRYRLRALITGSVLISSLILWAYIWQLIEWLDNALIHALYGEGLFQYTPQAFLADGVIGTLMIIAPLFWFTVMGAFGVASGQGVERLWAGLMAPSAAAAEAGGQQLGKVITQSVGR